MNVHSNGKVCLSCKDRYGISTFRETEIGDCVVCAAVGELCYISDHEQEIDWRIYTMGEIQFTHAPANATCRHCHRPYWNHPFDTRALALAGDGKPFLHVLCGGHLVRV